MRRLLTVIAATIAAGLVALGAIETSVRVTWNPRRGAPGFFVSDPIRIEKLGADYTGWFAGVPVRINRLGFRDTREYDIKKRPRTFRILVLGDSVTFGHGSVYEHTYPRLLEEALGEWRRDVDWQVWNLGVPGYNTSQELAYLLDVGPRFQPDLVIVGFYLNDVRDNYALPEPTRARRLTSAAANAARRHLYSLEWYRRLYLVWRSGAVDDAMSEPLLANVNQIEKLKEQALTELHPIDPEAFAQSRCGRRTVRRTVDPEASDGMLRAAAERDPGLARWKAAVRAFQDLHRTGAYRIVFFVNVAPEVCDDFFDPRSTRDQNEYFLRILGSGTPAVSSHDAFALYRPSEVPEAGGHSLGSANAVKAQVLARFLEQRILPGVLQ